MRMLNRGFVLKEKIMYQLKKQIKIIVMAALTVLCLLQADSVVKAESADNSLSSLKLSQGTLSPSFAYNVVNYTATVSADTASVEVTASTSNAAASIQSGTGTVSLKEGSNTVKIVVAAENGNLATYTITITRGASGSSEENMPADGSGTGTDMPADGSGTGTDTPADGSGMGADTPADGDGSTPAVSGAEGYTVASVIPEEVILPDFSETTVTYEGQEQKALSYNKGPLTLLYMTDAEGTGSLFVYEAESGSVYPMIRLTAGEHALILLRQSFDASLGENFAEASLIINQKSAPAAYQSTEADAGDYYLVYGINSAGILGWYQYDNAEGTYQRYRAPAKQEADTEETEEYEFLQKSYNDLSEKYTSLKNKDTKFITGLLIAVAVLMILIVNLLLFGRGRRAEKEETENIFKEEKREKKKKDKREERFPEETDEFFADDDDFLNFDDEPEFATEKRGKKKKKKRFGRREDIFDVSNEEDEYYDEEENELTEDIGGRSSIDEELEILDLNDL